MIAIVCGYFAVNTIRWVAIADRSSPSEVLVQVMETSQLA